MLRTASFALLLATLAAGSSLSGCMVPQNRYDRAVDRADAEQAERARAEAALAAARADVERLNALLNERSRHVDARDQLLSRSKLDEARLETERDDAAALVEQLRGELARAGDHLREYSEQKQALEAALAEAALGSAAEALEGQSAVGAPGDKPASQGELPAEAAVDAD
jgi:hypothetical protein